jgi:hypothetical protein
LPQTDPLPLDSQGGNKLVQVPQSSPQQQQRPQEDQLQETPRKVNEPSNGSNRRVQAEAANSNSLRQTEAAAPKRKQTFHEDKPGLQCYSCGSLLNPNKKCDTFSRQDKNQVATPVRSLNWGGTLLCLSAKKKRNFKTAEKLIGSLDYLFNAPLILKVRDIIFFSRTKHTYHGAFHERRESE